MTFIPSDAVVFLEKGTDLFFFFFKLFASMGKDMNAAASGKVLTVGQVSHRHKFVQSTFWVR